MAKLDSTYSSNRIFEAIRYYQEMSIEHQVNQPGAKVRDIKSADLQLQFYQELLKSFRKQLSPLEKETRRFLKYEIQRLKFFTKPNVFTFLQYNPVNRIAFSWLRGNYKSIQVNQLNLKQAQKSASERHSLVNLNNQLQKAGFTQNIDRHLTKMMEQGLQSFHYRYMDIRHPNTEFVLHFTKPKDKDLYILEKFEASPLPSWEKMQTHKPQYTLFNHHPSMHFSATEASNLVHGRGIAIEGLPDQWVTLDRSNIVTSLRFINFDLDAALKALPLPNLNNIELNNLKETLQMGGTKELTFEMNGQEKVLNLSAFPQTQAVLITDKNNQLINPASLEKRKEPSIAENLVMMQNHVNKQEYVPRIGR
jgi:hypothetical protein